MTCGAAEAVGEGAGVGICVGAGVGASVGAAVGAGVGGAVGTGVGPGLFDGGVTELPPPPHAASVAATKMTTGNRSRMPLAMLRSSVVRSD